MWSLNRNPVNCKGESGKINIQWDSIQTSNMLAYLRRRRAFFTELHMLHHRPGLDDTAPEHSTTPYKSFIINCILHEVQLRITISPDLLQRYCFFVHYYFQRFSRFQNRFGAIASDLKFDDTVSELQTK
jgi:hypothetical protein